MSDEQEYASAEELRQWLLGRGITPPHERSRNWDKAITGWNRKNPDRPYVMNRCGTRSKYEGHGCRCVECRAAKAAYDRDSYVKVADFDATP